MQARFPHFELVGSALPTPITNVTHSDVAEAQGAEEVYAADGNFTDDNADGSTTSVTCNMQEQITAKVR